MSRLGTESAFETLAQAQRLEAEGRDVIHLEIGEPDFSTPGNIIEAAIRALRDGATHYTPASGIWEVRQSTARYVTRQTGVETGPEQIVLVPGSKNVLYFLLLSLVEPGDEVLIPDPGYPIYGSLVSFVGATPVSVPIREENDFRLDVEEMRSLVTDRTRVLIERDLFVVSDEIYSRLVYEGSHVSPYSIDGMAERCVLMDGLSKAWAMCGWRLGYGAMPVELAERMDTLMINTASCTAAFTQWAAVEAFESPASDAAVTAMMAEFSERRDAVVDGLNAIPGVRCHRPAGAFYVFPNIEGTGWDERDLQQALLDEAGVALLAGSAFGAGGRGFLRLSYANSVANLERGIERIGNFLAGTTGEGRRSRAAGSS
jgi:aspartate/methionine/tyrosine aminotransferase